MKRRSIADCSSGPGTRDASSANPAIQMQLVQQHTQLLALQSEVGALGIAQQSLESKVDAIAAKLDRLVEAAEASKVRAD